MAGSNDPICHGVPPFPDWAEPSETYRQLFNKVAVELEYPIEWTGDVDGGLTNVPETNEISITPPPPLPDLILN